MLRLGVVLRRKLAAFHKRSKDFFALRPLQRDEAGFFGNIRKLRITEQMRLHMTDILVMRGCIHDHHVAVFPQVVHDEVIDNTTLFVQHRAVTHATDGKIGEIIRKQVIQARKRTLPLEKHFAHVRYIENPSLRAHNHMLRQDPFVILHRHQVAAKGNHLPFQCDMSVI